MHIYIFFFNDTATTEIYTLSLHDALPISGQHESGPGKPKRLPGIVLPACCHEGARSRLTPAPWGSPALNCRRSEEHTSELQSRQYLVCRLLLEKKKKNRS